MVTNILITAGPTWVALDNTRVISNIASGKTGALLAGAFRRLGDNVTLVAGEAEFGCVDKKVRVIRFKFFKELSGIVIKELKSRKYKIIIHSAAVSDYQPRKVFNKKIESGKNKLQIELVPTPKIISLMRRVAPCAFLVGFKFEPGAKKNLLLGEARQLLIKSGVDLVVANTIIKGTYRAYILNKTLVEGPFTSKDSMVRNLVKMIHREKKNI